MRAAGSVNPCAAAGRMRLELVELVRTALAAGPLELVAQGLSMRPALRPGDRVRLEARLPRRGEIVLAIVGKRLVLHRVLRRRGEAWLLRGDARRCADGWISAGDILGVATARARTGEPAPAWRRVDGGLARCYGLVAARLVLWARRVREGVHTPRRRVRPVHRSGEDGTVIHGPLRARRGRGSPDDGRGRTRSAAQAPREER